MIFALTIRIPKDTSSQRPKSKKPKLLQGMDRYMGFTLDDGEIFFAGYESLKGIL